MKIKINNIVGLVDALKEHGHIYCPDGAEVKLYPDDRIIFSHNGMRFPLSLDKLDNFRWGSEFETAVPLQHKQAVWAWNGSFKSARIATFYDKVNGSVFKANGARCQKKYDNYEPIKLNPDGSYPDGFEWMEEARKNLKD